MLFQHIQVINYFHCNKCFGQHKVASLPSKFKMTHLMSIFELNRETHIALLTMEELISPPDPTNTTPITVELVLVLIIE